MSDKTYKVVNGEISDGYHTFTELYEHRYALFLALIAQLKNNDAANGTLVYKVLDHFEGWDLIVYNNLLAGQISYHLPSRLRPYYEWIKEVDEGKHEFDGHTSDDVVKRLLEGLVK